MKTNVIHQGDCVKIMRRLIPDNSIDTLITNPPYGLSDVPDIVEVLTCWLAGEDYEHQGGGFMGRSWDSFVPGPGVWRECLRVLKPGGTALIFGGTRTHDLLMIALRIAGFEIKDCLMWLHGQGFPKSHSIGKAIDRSMGKERKVVRTEDRRSEYDGKNRTSKAININWRASEGRNDVRDVATRTITAPATPEAAEWEGYGTGLSPAWEPIIVAMKPREGTFAENALKFGVAGFWIDGGRIGNETITTHSRGNNGAFPKRPGEKTAEESGRSKDQRYIETNPRTGRWPANVLFEHLPGCVNRGMKRVKGSHPTGTKKNPQQVGDGGAFGGGLTGGATDHTDPDDKEAVADWQCIDCCPVKALDEQSSHIHSAGHKRKAIRMADKTGLWFKSPGDGQRYGDSGTASRFFYCAKSSKSERNLGCSDLYWRFDKSTSTGIVAIAQAEWEALPERERARGNVHPTVKPVEILKYLCTLTKTPTGGIILDPFAGSCSTALAAIRTGREYIMIERESEYVAIGQARIDEEERQPMLPGIFDSEPTEYSTSVAHKQEAFDFEGETA